MSLSENSLDVVRIKLVLDKRLYSEIPLSTPNAVYELMKQELVEYDREVFCILNMKANGQCTNMNIVSMGTLACTLVEPREVFKSAILSNASHILLVHNHPSGSVIPSKDDIFLTKRLVDCGKLLGIPVCDHVIIGGITGAIYSFQENGLLINDTLEETERRMMDIQKNMNQSR